MRTDRAWFSYLLWHLTTKMDHVYSFNHGAHMGAPTLETTWDGWAIKKYPSDKRHPAKFHSSKSKTVSIHGRFVEMWTPGSLSFTYTVHTVTTNISKISRSGTETRKQRPDLAHHCTVGLVLNSMPGFLMFITWTRW